MPVVCAWHDQRVELPHRGCAGEAAVRAFVRAASCLLPYQPLPRPALAPRHGAAPAPQPLPSPLLTVCVTMPLSPLLSGCVEPRLCHTRVLRLHTTTTHTRTRRQADLAARHVPDTDGKDGAVGTPRPRLADAAASAPPPPASPSTAVAAAVSVGPASGGGAAATRACRGLTAAVLLLLRGSGAGSGCVAAEHEPPMLHGHPVRTGHELRGVCGCKNWGPATPSAWAHHRLAPRLGSCF